jgi:hypothetical protein
VLLLGAGLLGYLLVEVAGRLKTCTASGGVGLAVFSAVMTVLVGSTLAVPRHAAQAGLLRPGTPKRCCAGSGS